MFVSIWGLVSTDGNIMHLNSSVKSKKEKSTGTGKSLVQVRFHLFANVNALPVCMEMKKRF